MVGDTAPGLFRVVTGDRAVVKHQAAFIIDATAKRGETIAHSHAGAGDPICARGRSRGRGDIEDAKLRNAAGSAPLDSQVAGPWPRNRQGFVDNQLTLGERNGAEARSEVNRVAGRGAGNSLTQRSG